MNIKPGLCNLWIFACIGYALIWIGMIWANRKRGALIEDPEIYKYGGRKFMTVMVMLPTVALFIAAIFIPLSDGVLLWCGFIIFASGIIINLVSMHSFAHNTSGLNRAGIYRYSRNPMYIGGFLFLAGLNLMGWRVSAINSVFCILSLIWVAATHWTVLQEESFLEYKYGDSFTAYSHAVPRYLGIPKR
jgi:protein-S-isoprenylcysteine O-methyltransferase Ste14